MGSEPILVVSMSQKSEIIRAIGKIFPIIQSKTFMTLENTAADSPYFVNGIFAEMRQYQEVSEGPQFWEFILNHIQWVD